MKGADNFLVLVSILILGFSVVNLFESYNILRDAVTGNAVADSSGQVNVNVTNLVSFDFVLSKINWGPGYVYSYEDYATLDTLGNVGNGTWQNVSEGFVIVNNGNVNLTVNLSSGKTAAGFLGGSSPSYKYNVTAVDGGACVPGSGFDLGEFYSVSPSPTSQNICDSFLIDSNIRIDLSLVVPVDSHQGNLTDIFSVIASAKV